MNYFDIEFTRVNSDMNGNPRYVTHWTNFGTKTYEEALNLSRKIGGRKFHNKSYGGGIVLQSYNIESEASKIALLAGSAF